VRPTGGVGDGMLLLVELLNGFAVGGIAISEQDIS